MQGLLVNLNGEKQRGDAIYGLGNFVRLGDSPLHRLAEELGFVAGTAGEAAKERLRDIRCAGTKRYLPLGPLVAGGYSGGGDGGGDCDEQSESQKGLGLGMRRGVK